MNKGNMIPSLLLEDRLFEAYAGFSRSAGCLQYEVMRIFLKVCQAEACPT